MSNAFTPVSDNHARGIYWMLLTMVLIGSQDTLAKYLSQFYPVPVVVWVRYLVHFIILSAILAPRLKQLAPTTRPGLQAVRSILLYLITIFFIVGLTYMPIAEATAVMFVSPLLVTAFSVPLLGENVGIRRWVGVAVGLVGALVIIRPGTEMMQWAALLPLAAAVTFALFQISNRIINRTDHVLTSLFYSSVGGTVISSAILPLYWEMPALEHWPLLVLLGVIGASTHFAMLRAFAFAPAAVVSPFSYTGLIWAVLLGYLVFAEVPDMWTISGALIIVISGLYILFRERSRKAG